MNFSRHPDDSDDFRGNIHVEAHNEMVQQWGMEQPEAEWILTDYDVWEKNPYFTGVPSGRHPEDDEPEENTLDIYKNSATVSPMKNNIRLHFGSSVAISAKQAGKDADSGNGYYSYSFYLLPYTGTLTEDASRAVHQHLHKRHYYSPFASLHCVEKFGDSEYPNGGMLIVGVTYHHGD